MNNNRGNNRRRGRGNNRPQGGGQQLNRIDSRARGNAPQLLEKYRKLAHDAHLNGDRVTAEYYLQFADHYFRVIADTRVRQDEQRQRRDERWQEQPEEADEGSEFTVESDFPAFDQPVYTRREREEREPRDREPREFSGREGNGRDREARRRDEREPRAEEAATVADAAADDDNAVYEPAANPFVRDNRGTRGLRPRREDRRPRPVTDEAADGYAGRDEPPATLDAALLPPSFAARDSAGDADADADAAPKRRGRKPKLAAPADDEA